LKLSIYLRMINFNVFIISYNFNFSEDNSPVFAKMFEHELKESIEKYVKVNDADPEVMREMLRYFYTSQVNNIMDIGIRLYNLADKYMVDSLKTFCTRSFLRGVNKDTALEIYCFARDRDIPDLMNKAAQVLTA